MAYKITEECTGCTACARLCPVFAISGERGAVHIINEKRCVDCGVCARACPKEVVTDSSGKRPGKLPRKQWPKPVICKEGCSACQMCVDICTPGALSISPPVSKGDIDVFAQLSNPAKCVGCGICADICPLDVITMESPKDTGGAA